MHVRAYTPRDRDELERLVRSLFPEHANAEWAELAPRSDGTALFVIDRGDGRLGGYVEAGTRSYAEGCDSSPVAYVEAWYVDRDLRRQGWGRKLFATVEAWARANGHSELASDAVLDNHVSIAAHEALGFVEVERQVHFKKRL